MSRVGFVGRTIYIAVLFLCFGVTAFVGFQRDDDPIVFALTFGCLLALAIAAVCLVAWIIDRRAGAAFVSSLTDAELIALRAFEAVRGWASWRDSNRQRSQPPQVSGDPRR
jgi:hypothetical protein